MRSKQSDDRRYEAPIVASLAFALLGVFLVLNWRPLNSAGSTPDLDLTPAIAQPTSGRAPAPITIDEQLRRFRETVTVPAPAAMSGERSMAGLVRRFVTAIEKSDTNAFRELVLTRAEFAYLYYPESPYTHAPYRQDPGVLWFLIQEGSNKGLTRLVRRYGGHPLGYIDIRCVAPPDVHGRSKLWGKCMIRRRTPAGDIASLFGTIIERDGRFRLLSYANEL